MKQHAIHLAVGLISLLAARAPAQPQIGPAVAPDRAERPDGVAPSAQNNALAGEITPELDQAVTRGLAALARAQNGDGSFGDSRWGRSVAITSLACLAFMSDGHLPGRGMYGPVVLRGLDFVLQNVSENGLIAAESANGPMYGHGFATLFLGEIYGMMQGQDEARDARIHEALVKAVRLIQQTQNDEGGWRYNPVPYDADSSVTICQIMALRSARNAGLEVPKETIDRAVEYVRRCQNPDGGFKYQLSGGPSAWPRSAAGVATFYYAGIYKDEAIDRGIEYLMTAAFPTRTDPNRAHYFYGHYYAVQAVYLAGGEYWARWWPEIRRQLLQMQNPDGSWPDATVGDAYGTAMALIILQMPKRYLPIFQK
jgi:hypothetical protein